MCHRNRWLLHTAWIGVLLALTGCPAFQPLLSVSPAAFSFDSAKVEGTLIVANAGGGTLTWTIDSKPDWLTVSPSGGTLVSDSTVLLIQADFSGLAAGQHMGEIHIASNGGNRGIAVGAVVVAPPQIEIEPTLVDFGGSATSETFIIRNTGGSTLNWTIHPPLSQWLGVSPQTGSTPSGGTATITVTLDRSGLSPGTQVGPLLIQLNSNGGAQVVTIQAVVQALSVTPTVLDFGTQLNQLPLTLANHGDSDLHWAIDQAGLPAWLQLPPDGLSGTIASEGQQIVAVNIDRATLPPGLVIGEIPISSDGGQETIHVRVTGPEPVLLVLPTALDFSSNKTSETFTIQNTGTGTLNWTVEEGTAPQGPFVPGDVVWLSVTGNVSGQTLAGETTTLTVQIDRTQVAPDAEHPYAAELRVRSVDGQAAVVEVSMRALPPALRILPTHLSFGTTYTRKNLAIWNEGLGIVSWRIDTAGKPGWVMLDPVDANGIASGSVSGDQTSAVTVTVDRTGIAPADQDYAWSFNITGTDGTSAALAPVTVRVTMNVARVPTIMVDTGSVDGVPNVDNNGVAFLPFGTDNNESTFIIGNLGTGTLTWSIDLAHAPAWVKQVEPAQGALEPLHEVTVTVRVDRAGLPYGDAAYTLMIESNDPNRPKAPVRIEMQIPKVVIIGVLPAQVALGINDISDSFDVANLGDPGSTLNFEITSNKPWLYFYPDNGVSAGTADIIKDWQTINISIDRSQLTGTGDRGELTITAFEIDESGNRVTLSNVSPVTVPVTVQAAPLSFEAAKGRTRIPSLVRFVLLMRDIAYNSISLGRDLLDGLVDSFTVTETVDSPTPIDLQETNKFLTPGANLKTTVVILMDYSGSMLNAVTSVNDRSIANAPDPLQAFYARCVGALIQDLPSHYRIALMEFHDRSQATRVVTDGGPLFTTDKTVLLNRLASISVIDHGATELLPAVLDASQRLAEWDDAQFYMPFDDSDVRALICITDGRLTTPPGRVKETLDFVTGFGVRFFPVGWGMNVFHEPLARIASGSGGHYYATASESSGIIGSDGKPIVVPVVANLVDWCTTDDPAVNACDVSIAKDLQSQVVLSYTTLTEYTPTNVRIDAKFDNPNDDNGECLAEQGLIAGSLTQKQFDFESIAGDTDLGQISLRTDGVQGNQARVIIRAEYVPRNIGHFEFTVSAPNLFTVTKAPMAEGGLVEGWTSSESGTFTKTYQMATPNPDVPLPYGAFGDLLYIDFSDIPPASVPFTVSFTINNGGYGGLKYFMAPDSIPVGGQAFFAPALPTPRLTVTQPPANTPVIDFGQAVSVAQFTIQNIGASYDPTAVRLQWAITNAPSFVTITSAVNGEISSTTAVIPVNLTLDRTLAAGTHAGEIDIEFLRGSLNTPVVTAHIPVTASILNPILRVTSADFVTGSDNQINFDVSGDTADLTITNAGQSTLNWSIPETPPAWLQFSVTRGAIPLNTVRPLQVSVLRSSLPTGANTFQFTINSDGGLKVISLTVTGS